MSVIYGSSTEFRQALEAFESKDSPGAYSAGYLAAI